MVSLLRLIRPMRVGLILMGAFLAFWLPWKIWFETQLRREPIWFGLGRIAVAALLLWLLFAVLSRLRVLTDERVAAIDSLLERVDRPAGRKG